MKKMMPAATVCALWAAAAFSSQTLLDASTRSAPLNVSSNEVAANGFTVKLAVHLDAATANETLLEIPGALTLSLRLAGKDQKLSDYDRNRGNYLNFPMKDGSCPVLEAVIPGAAGRVGIPLGFLEKPSGTHGVTLHYTGAHWSILVDGHKDDDLPLAPPAWPENAVCLLRSPRVASAQFSSPALADALPPEPDAIPANKPISFFTPADHNAWVGDVVTGWFKNRYHIFYLFDRRHHGSKGGKGGHYFAHLSTSDLVHWFEHPIATPIERQWETFGTGTPFIYEGKLHLAYGLHTTRLFPYEKTTGPIQDAYLKEHNKMGTFKMSEIKGVPMGATYAVSDDGGIHFRKSGILFHTAQNPTVYNRADGLMGLVASYGGGHGIWVSKTLSDWTIRDDKIPIGGDCPCPFDWNGWHYLLQGFTGFCASPDDKPGSYVDWVAKGDDIYDGNSVPMVSPFTGNRRILAGWISHPAGWGGWLSLREIIQYPDGALGTKWVPECIPAVPQTALTDAASTANLPPDGRVMFTATIDPKKGISALRFTPRQGRKLELQLNPAERRAQFADADGDAFAQKMPTLQEKQHPVDKELAKRGGTPNSAHTFAIGHIRGMDKPFTVRVIAWFDPKSNDTLFDAEIAGQRTMICHRSGLFTAAELK